MRAIVNKYSNISASKYPQGDENLYFFGRVYSPERRRGRVVRAARL